ncbi:hypothetical protein K7432_014252 [Basidiobolus ranarum]|uniref:Uncharacterized protein n=1 Tax=Basidiobolus ranarum TaxID=34480 RepID=A0ABR2WHZ3_9FUNG
MDPQSEVIDDFETSTVVSSIDSPELKALERRLVWKQDLFILPFISLMYLFASLTRGNIGNARLGGIEKDLDINGAQFHNIVTMFFVGYIICQIPSTMTTRIVSPSKWIGFVMVIWGICATW